ESPGPPAGNGRSVRDTRQTSWLSSGLAQRAAAALRTGLERRNRACLAVVWVARFAGVDQLVGVVVHFHAAPRADHRGIRGHNVQTPQPSRLDGNLLAPVAERLSHPDEFFQKLVN